METFDQGVSTHKLGVQAPHNNPGPSRYKKIMGILDQAVLVRKMNGKQSRGLKSITVNIEL